MSRWRRYQGDIDDIAVVADLGVGAVAGVNDLSTVVSVEAHVSYGGAAPVVLAAAVTDAAASEVTVQLGTAGGWLATAELGCWRFTRVYTFAGGVGPVTWPEVPDEIEVAAGV